MSRQNYPKSFQRAWLWFFVTMILVALAWVGLRKGPDAPVSRDQQLIVYCAAGMRMPVEEAAKAFESAYGVPIRLDYGSSGELEGKIELELSQNNPRCDLYIPADLSFAQRAQSKGLTRERIPLAHFSLVLAAKPGQLAGLEKLESLWQKQISYGICDTKAGAGKKTKEILDRLSVWEKVRESSKVTFPRVTELAGAIKTSDTVQAGFVWDSTARQFGLDILPMEHLEANRSEISANVTTSSQHPTWALRFARFLAAPDQGGPVFERHFFTPSHGDAWSLRPEVVFYCGGVNRDAVSEAIQHFQEREGCEIQTQFAGCGTIVGSIRSGRMHLPDLFMTCDVSYMAMVQDDFNRAQDVSSTRICMLVRKGNPKGLNQLQDLTQPGLAIGTTDPQMSTLGALSHAMFEDLGLAETLRAQKSIVVTAPTAHELILQMEGHDKLDVVLVYEANCQNLESSVEIVSIDHPLALATQNIATARQSKYPALMARLMQEVLSARSRASFIRHGFEWKGPIEQP